MKGAAKGLVIVFTFLCLLAPGSARGDDGLPSIVRVKT